jgi:hypothetical protein
MTTFLAPPFSLVEGDHIGVIVEALNVIDYSVPSIVNSVGEKALVKPHTPLTKPRRDVLTNEAQIEVLIDPVTAKRGSAIMSYSVEINDGTGFKSYVGYLADNLSLDTFATGLSSGVMHNLRYRAKNVHGWSDYYPSELIVANTLPFKASE